MPADVLSGSHHPRLLVRPEAAEPKQGRLSGTSTELFFPLS